MALVMDEMRFGEHVAVITGAGNGWASNTRYF
jgi:hypothetical protein